MRVIGARDGACHDGVEGSVAEVVRETGKHVGRRVWLSILIIFQC